MTRLIFIASLGLAGALTAAEVGVTISPFQKPATLLSDRNFRFLQTEAFVAEGQNSATHILIEGLVPVSVDTPLVVSSPYTAINIDTGAEQDAGVVILDLPAEALPAEGVVTSPIVGIVQRAGAWSSQNPAPVATTVGGSSGDSTYNTTAKTISFTLDKGGQAVSGSTTYTAPDTDTLELAAFSLTVGAQAYDFQATTLTRDGTTFSGLLDSNGLPPLLYDPNSLMFLLTLIDQTDLDGDGVPDLVDPTVVDPGQNWYTGATDIGSNSFDSPWLGKYTLLQAGHDKSWLFHWEHGYVYVNGLSPQSVFFYDLGLGWVWTGQGLYPFYYQFSRGTWLQYSPGSGSTTSERWFYNYSAASGSEWEHLPISGY